MRENPQSKLEKLDEYDKLLREHTALMEKLRRLQRSVRAKGKDPETMETILKVDLNTNKVHIKLLSVARKLGMTESDVLADTLRLLNSLEEYGLPEFSILNPDDIESESVFEGEHYVYNINDVTGKPTEGIISKKKAWEHQRILEKHIENPEKDYHRAIGGNEVLIIFSVSTKIVMDNEVVGVDDPTDKDVRIQRARALAKEIEGRFFEGSDISYHSGPASIIGVVVKKNQIIRIASIIRDNPDRYRLGEEFYSDDEMALVKKRKEQQDKEWDEIDKRYGL